MTLDIPRFKCHVEAQYLTNRQESGLIEAYCFAVTLLESRPLLFTVHLVSGAVYSRLPLCAIVKDSQFIVKKEYINPDKWGAISSHGCIIEHEYLKDYEVEHIETKNKGRYMFTIDYTKGGFSQDPEQHKCAHIISMESNQICSFTNNEILFLDKHFVDHDYPIGLARNSNYYTV